MNAFDSTPTFDEQLGRKLKQRRLLLGITQEKLAAMLGITFQQIQKYERNLNRISASRLSALAQALRVPVDYFYNETPAPAANSLAETSQEAIIGGPGSPREPALPILDISSRETANLLRAYYRIADAKKRRRVLDLIRAMEDEGS